MRRLLMVAIATGGALGLLDVLIRLTPLDGHVHWHAILIAFVIMPAIIVGLTRRLKEGAAPLVAAVGLSLGHVLGLGVTWWGVHGYLWNDLYVAPLMTVPALLLTATLTRAWMRRDTAKPAQVSTTGFMDFEQARARARQRMRQ